VEITLDTSLALAQLVALLLGGFKIWRKIDTRLTAQDNKLAKIEYALFNDGRGMEQQLKEVHKNQQAVIVDLAVLKAKSV
jgi:3-mercaptopyruvate sulfurtransferase SseA